MTVVRPFRALRYDTGRVDLSKVIVPPYDVVADDERAAFFDRDPHNAIRFELTRDARDEARADYLWIRETLDDWRASGVLVRDAEPAFYVMSQAFKAPSGERLERIGFFAELGLEEYEARVVRPHERTLAGPKADRLKLLRAAEANLSSVFLLYEDPADTLGGLLGEALERASLASASDASGVEYRLAAVRDPEQTARIRDFLSERPSVIADGHHRYETALEYRRERRREAGDEALAPWQSTVAFLANAYAPGSLLLPIHRVVREAVAPDEAAWREALPGWRVERLPAADGDPIEALLARELTPHASSPAFVAESAEGQRWLVRREEPLGERLMVRILEQEVLAAVFGLDEDAVRGGAVAFPKSAARAAQTLRDGEGSVALYLNPMPPEDVFRATAEGEVMPQKSTFFYPKVPTGMVFRDHRDGAAGSGGEASR